MSGLPAVSTVALRGALLLGELFLEDRVELKSTPGQQVPEATSASIPEGNKLAYCRRYSASSGTWEVSLEQDGVCKPLKKRKTAIRISVTN